MNTKPTRHFCTLFDRNYLFKGLALHASLMRHCGDFVLHILCMDEVARKTLEELRLPRVELIPIAEFEDEELRRAKQGRTAAEYCWTCTPSLPLYVLERQPQVELITYLDADLYFFSDPEPLFDEIGAGSVAIVEHRFADDLKHLVINGIYNVEWVSFRRDEAGMSCLRWWQERCNEWCYNRLEDGRMGDQKYLDDWPERFPNVHVLEHIGAGVAPWNFANYRYAEKAGGIYVDDVPLVFYHFHQFQLIAGGRYFYMAANYTESRPAPAMIYTAYERALSKAIAEVQQRFPGFKFGIRPYITLSLVLRRTVTLVGKCLPEGLKNDIKAYLAKRAN